MQKFLRTRWYKVIRDMWLNRTRTVLVVLSIAVGVFAMGVITNAQLVLSRDLAAGYAAANPSHATILTLDSFGEDVVEAIRRMPEVAEAEARRNVYVRIQTGPDEWRLSQFVAIADFDDMRLDLIEPESGDWPPADHEVLIERSTLTLTGANVGDVLRIKTPAGKERDIRIGGLAHDVIYAKLYALDGAASGYITEDTLAWLGESADFNEMHIRVKGDNLDRATIQAVTDKVQDKIERGGRAVLFAFIPNPDQHPLDYVIQAILLILGALGFLALLLSSFLVINTISALLAQQTRQIGMMKAIGARTDQIVKMYLVTVVIYGLLTLIIAVPLGAIGAQIFTTMMADFLNFNITHFDVPPQVLVLEVVVALAIPIMAGLFPVRAGTRITVQEAVSDYGLGKGRFGVSRFDRGLVILQERLKWLGLSRPLMLSFRNTFRHKKRLTLTLVTLILGGAIFVATFSLQASLLSSLDSMLDYYQYDVGVQFSRPYRVKRIIEAIEQLPGVAETECWGFYNTRLMRPDGTHSGNVILFAPPADTKLVNPTIMEGRWLLPEDDRAVVVNTIFLRGEPDLGIGDDVILKIEGEESTWRIVGIAQGGQVVGMVFANYEAFARVIGEVGRAEWLMVLTDEHDLSFQEVVLRNLEETFEKLGMNINITVMIAQEMAEVRTIFQIVLVMLLVMTILLATVGGLGLMGTMSINVLERTREIGVMRAVGASNRSILKIFMTEGVLIGLLSWLIGVVIAWPVSRMLSEAVGQQLLNASLDYVFPISGVIIWLGVVVIMSALASFLPAWNASRLTVREVLAYE